VQELETQRLKLVPFSLELKKVTLTDRAKLTGMLGVKIPDTWPGNDLLEVLPFFMKQTEQDPARRVWDVVVIHKADQIAIGGIGFHGPPDGTGMVEIGYNIIPEYEGQGYATEMARGIIAWALQTPEITRVSAECLATNIGSIRVLEKVGMRRLAPEGEMLRWEICK